jgi:hypothetical protein
MRVRDLVPVWRLERWQQRRAHVALPADQGDRLPCDDLLRDIAALPDHWHGAGVCGTAALRAIAHAARSRHIAHSAETGVGKSTLLFSHLSAHHTVFALDDTGSSNSLQQVRESPLLNSANVTFVVGPTQQTLPQHAFGHHRLQLVLLDGPHGYPSPELEYYFFLRHLDEDAVLVIDDIHIPTIFRLFSFMKEEAMFDYLGRVSTTAFFRRNAASLVDPLGDNWWLQNFNRRRFPIRRLDRTRDLVPPRYRGNSAHYYDALTIRATGNVRRPSYFEGLGY